MFIVQLLVKFRFFIEELWERKSLQILYECWRRAYHALLAQLFISYIMARTSFSSIRWWWRSLCTKQHHIWIFIVRTHWNSNPRLDISHHSGHVILIPSQTVPCCCFLVPRANRNSSKYQFYSLWFDPIEVRTHDLLHSR